MRRPHSPHDADDTPRPAFDARDGNEADGIPPDVVDDDPELDAIEWVDDDAEAEEPAALVGEPAGKGDPADAAPAEAGGDGAVPEAPVEPPPAEQDAAGTAPPVRVVSGAGEHDLSLDPGVSADAERAALLAEVLRDQALRARALAPEPPRRSSPLVRAGAGVLVVLAAYVWFTPPDWLQPRTPPPVPIVLQEAGLRLGMYLQAQQIEAFRRREGRLPDVLAEAGEPVPGMHYRRLDARVYRLHGVAPQMALTYVSTDSLPVFLSDAHRVVGFVVGR